MATPGHVASLRWQDASDCTAVLDRRPSQPATPEVTLVQQPAAAVRALLLAPDTDLNRAPTPPTPSMAARLKHSHFGLPPTASAGGGGYALAGLPDIFSSARAEFASSALAAMGGEAPVHFIAPSEHMKQLFTLPFTSGRVAFPVHRVGNALVLDGGVPSGAYGRRAAGEEMSAADTRARAEQALMDALGRIGLLSSQPTVGPADAPDAALALPPPPSFPLTTMRVPAPPLAAPTPRLSGSPPLGGASTGAPTLPSGAAGASTHQTEPPSLYSRFLHHSVPGDGGVTPAFTPTSKSPDDSPALSPVMTRAQTPAESPAEFHAASPVRSAATPPASPHTAAASHAVCSAPHMPNGGSGACGHSTGVSGSAAAGPAVNSGGTASAGATTQWTFWQPPSGRGGRAAGGRGRPRAGAAEGGDGCARDTRWTYWTSPTVKNTGGVDRGGAGRDAGEELGGTGLVRGAAPDAPGRQIPRGAGAPGRPIPRGST
eukprot:scaffold5659_cov121-Isochrysis_galbana.AAC.1